MGVLTISMNNKLSMNKYVGCEECAYQNSCHNFDAFFGCNEGKYMPINRFPLCNEVEDPSILCDGPDIVNRMLNKSCGVYFN